MRHASDDWERYLTDDYFRTPKPEPDPEPSFKGVPPPPNRRWKSQADPMPREERIETVFEAVKSKNCHTIPDIARELGISPRQTSAYVRVLVLEGILIRNGHRNSNIDLISDPE